MSLLNFRISRLMSKVIDLPPERSHVLTLPELLVDFALLFVQQFKVKPVLVHHSHYQT